MRMVIDPRCGRKKKHDYAEILTYVVVGYLVGRLSLRRCLAWCNRHLNWLQNYLELKNGIASVAIVSRLLSSIDEEMFCQAFIEWMTELLDTRGIHIAIDGKALRGGTERIKDGKTPYILNAIDTITGLVIAQLPIQEKDKIGDELIDDVHLVGIISNIKIGAEKALEIKRAHWKIENSLHHVLDDVFREDRSSARKSKNNLALIRKFAYNILKIACIQNDTGKGHQEMSDMFADNLNLIAKYVFSGIEGFR